MIKFLGNTGSLINWDDVIAGLERHEYESHPGPNDPIPDIGSTYKEGKMIPLLDQVMNIWSKEGYKTVETGGTVQWDMFLPGKHYDQSVQDKFCEIFEITPKSTSWISRIRPGRQAPIHWDVHDEEELLKDPDAVRWHCHIGKPEFGHVFVCENEVFYNRQQGDVFQWNSRRYWHAGSNCGLVPKYMFNLW